MLAVFVFVLEVFAEVVVVGSLLDVVVVDFPAVVDVVSVLPVEVLLAVSDTEDPVAVAVPEGNAPAGEP